MKKYNLIINTKGLAINGTPIGSDAIELPLRAENQQDAEARAKQRVANFEARSGNTGVQYSVTEVSQ